MRNITKYLSMLMVVLSILVFASQTKAQTTLFTEGWEGAAIGTTPPAGWVNDQMGYGNWISFGSSGSLPAALPYEGVRMVIFDSWDAPNNYTNRVRRSTPINAASWTNLTVDFTEYQQTTFSGGDGITVQWSTDGTNWTSAGTNWSNYGPLGWVIHTQALPAGAASATLYLGFLFTSQFGYDTYMDIIHIKGTPPPAGNLTGTVRNCITNATLAGVSVTCANIGPVLTNASGVYTLTGVYAGPQTITATLANYSAFSAPVTVVANTTTTYNFCMLPIPVVLSGVVTNASNNGNPVVGAKVSWGAYYTYSTAGGAYSMNVYSAGTNPLTASKEGFTFFSQAGVTLTPPAVPPPTSVVINIGMLENTPAPTQPFTAALNPGQTAVNLNWGLPFDNMVLIYDDGIQDNFAIWAFGGGNNMNAMKFTPISYPATVTGFYLNIGTANNYPPGSNAFSPVQMAIYSDAGGLPGVALSPPVTITPTVYGWAEYNPNNVTITSGNFFLVMIQLGNSNASPGIAIDTTVQQLRSYSKFGSSPWIPGPGNFMIRAVVYGSGGPLLMGDQSGTPITASAVPGLIYQYAPATITGVEGSPKVYPEMGDNPDILLGYQVWRLLQGQETTPALWTSVGTSSTNSIVDNSWLSLPCGGYRWAVEAQYTFNRWSNAIFSTAIGKCWTCNLTVNVNLSCDSASAAGAIVKLQNLDVPDTSYTYVMTASGTHTFTNFWKGNYTLTVTLFPYITYIQTPISILGDMTINVTLLQIKGAPTGLHVDDSTLLATWYPPIAEVAFFNEPFTGGFTTNAWVPDAGSNWSASGAGGNPGACALWNWSPEVLNYSQSLTSKLMVGFSAPKLLLRYDIYLSNFITVTIESMAVEVWDGTTWHTIKTYDNSAGSFNFKTETVDISSFAPAAGFKVRFRAFGSDSFWINNWNLDNVKVVATTDPHDPCVIGYNFYLNNVIQAFTTDTFYNIPPANVVYGTLYHACVLAIYGSGYSAQSCYDFTSHFLCPPNSLTGIALECSAYLTWQKPNCGGCTLTQYLSDDNSGEVGWDINAGALAWLGNKYPLTATQAGVIKSFDLNFVAFGSSTNQQLTIDVYSGAQTLIASSAPFTATAGTWINVPVSDIPYTGTFYGMVKWANVPGTSHYLNQDENGPQHNLALGYYMDPTNGWLTMGAATGYPEGSFLLRANVCQNDKKSDAVVVEEKTPEPNTGPIVNLLASHVEYPSFTPAPLVTPDAPAANPILVGYRVFRNGIKIADINNPNTLEYYDLNQNPGSYDYTVDAWYNVNPFNPPSFRDNSQPAGPVTVQLACGYPLPFFEPWNGGSFGYQKWTFGPTGQGNWVFNTITGNPTPCADFEWQPPILTNYDFSLITPNLDATAWTCADIFLDFDVKLVDHNATKTEKLDVDVLIGGIWKNKLILPDSGSFDWSSEHIDITPVIGKGFQVRFRAHGPNSANIQHWYVDNIHIYGVCRPPLSLAGHQNQFTTSLTWHSPVCPVIVTCSDKQYMYDSGVAGDGYTTTVGMMGNYFPLAASVGGIIKSVDMYFSSLSGVSTAQNCTVTFYAPDQSTILGVSAVFLNTGATWPSGTWVNVLCPDIPYTGPFYAMIDYTAASYKNFFDVDITSQPAGFPQGLGYVEQNGVWGLVAPTFGFDPIATFLERVNVCENSKDKDAPITTIDPSQLPAMNNVLPHLGANINAGAITNGSNVTVPPPPVIAPQSPEGSQSLGYNVYRTKDDSINGSFIKVNTSFVSDTFYTEVHAPATQGPLSWKYYVTVVFQDSLNPGHILCEPSSDTITINFPVVGINDLTNSSISLYPNPANDVVNIVSTNDIKTIEVLNYIGQTVYTNYSVNLKKAQLNVTSFKSGVYFVKISTTSGIKTTKITVTH